MILGSRFILVYVSGTAKGRHETLSGELTGLAENLCLRRAACRQFKQELHAQPRSTNAGLPTKHSRVGDDQAFCHCGIQSTALPAGPPGFGTSPTCRTYSSSPLAFEVLPRR